MNARKGMEDATIIVITIIENININTSPIINEIASHITL
jgi:hypothetical protein